MGARFSGSRSVAATRSAHLAAKLVTPEGQLRQYAGNATTVSFALADCSFDSSSFFLCDADALFFGEPAPTMSVEEPLLPGHLYFVLPGEMSRHPLSGADMGALAVRATSAESAPSDGEKGGRRVTNKSKSHGTSKCRGKCRVAPILQNVDVIYDGDVDFKRSIKQHRRAPASSPFGMNRAISAAHRRGAPAGNTRKVVRRVSFRVTLGTIDEEAAH